MNVWNVKPGKAIGTINFGDSRMKVREALGSSYTEFKKSKFSKNTTDDYGDFHIFYDADNNCEAVEVFENIELFIAGVKVFPGTIEVLQELFDDIVDDGYSLISKENSIGVTYNNSEIESMLIGKENYYSE